MKTILFHPVTFNLAETTRMIEVARKLSADHRLVFLGYEPDFVQLITDAGFDYRPGTPSWGRAEREQALRFDQGKTLRSPFTRDLVARRVAWEREMLRVESAAVVIGSNVTSKISARAERVPLVYPVPFALTGPQVRQTRRMGFVSGDGRLARGADRFATAAFRWIYTSAPLGPRSFASVAKEYGVAPLRTVASLLEADLNLLTVLRSEIDGYELPTNYRRVGPIFAHLPGEIPDVVIALAAASEPLVYLGLGSSADRKLALAAAARLGEMPVNVVAPIAHYLEPGDRVPTNVHVTGLLPAQLLGGLVDAAVLHGGQGTVQTACATGIPFVGMGLQPEQVWNVEVCVRQGNAIAVSPKRVGGLEFTDAVQRVLTEPGFRAAAKRVQAEFAAEDGAAAAAGQVERVARGSA